MQIKKLYLKNFRNYSEETVEFSDGLNVLYGANAAGKTNMLEAVYLTIIAKTPRTTKEKELVLEGEKYAVVKVLVENNFRSHKVEIIIDDKGKKRILVDSLPINRAGELIGVVAVVFFSPDEMKLVKESPDYRRRFLDISLSQQQKEYFNALVKYNKILKQRNNLLKSEYDDMDAMLDVYDVQLSDVGLVILDKRREFVNTLKTYALKTHKFLSDNGETLEVEYETELTKDNFLKLLKKNREKDKKLSFTTVGPHRDDLKLIVNGKDARKFASQGQQRSIALSLKFAELELYKIETGEKAVLLLDDVLSELDVKRRTQLLELSKEYQTILTCTEFDSYEKAVKFKIENGKIIKREY